MDGSIHEMLQIDVFGPKRMLDFAHECKNLLVFNHISTAFVNSNQKPWSIISEKIHPNTGAEDFEVQIKKILETDLTTLEQNITKFTNNHVNTYVFTKDLAERYLERYRGDLRVVINRPSMI